MVGEVVVAKVVVLVVVVSGPSVEPLRTNRTARATAAGPREAELSFSVMRYLLPALQLGALAMRGSLTPRAILSDQPGLRAGIYGLGSGSCSLGLGHSGCPPLGPCFAQRRCRGHGP